MDDDMILSLSLSKKDDVSIVSSLFDEHAATITSNSSMDSFNFNEDDNVKSYNPAMTNYSLNISNPYDTKEELIHDLLYPEQKGFLENKSGCLHAWRSIALMECRAYLRQNLLKVGFTWPFIPGKKTDETIYHLLDNFSESQIFGMIYNRITYATRYY